LISLLRNGEILKSKQKLIPKIIKEKSFSENSQAGLALFFLEVFLEIIWNFFEKHA